MRRCLSAVDVFFELEGGSSLTRMMTLFKANCVFLSRLAQNHFEIGMNSLNADLGDFRSFTKSFYL
jgi:hypothetical protein